jgi:hypothetical protein
MPTSKTTPWSQDEDMGSMYPKVIAILKTQLTKKEWVALGEELDGDPHMMGFLDAVNEHLAIIAPEVFSDGCLQPDR